MSSSKEAEKLFTALDQLDQVTDFPNTPPVKVSFNELYAYATRSSYKPSDTLHHALKTDLKIRRELNHLLSKQSIVHMPRAAAASSGDIDIRETDGFHLTLKPSKANPEQVYLIIQAIDRDESPTLLFINQADGPTLRLVIDDFYDAEAQILLSIEDDIVKALRKNTSEVILR